MSVRAKPNKRLKVGVFSSEKEALEAIEKKKTASNANPASIYRVTRLQRVKRGKDSWLAYSLTKKGQ